VITVLIQKILKCQLFNTIHKIIIFNYYPGETELRVMKQANVSYSGWFWMDFKKRRNSEMRIYEL
jgi:hypothetical protein